MKKILVALMAVMMTMGLMAQCPQQKTCTSQQAGQCQKECVKRSCVYSPETCAMMQVDRLARVIKDLTTAEREQLLAFYKTYYEKCKSANQMTKGECRSECNAELRRVLGDERYIKYLETMKVTRMNCEKRQCPRGDKSACHRGGERPAGCQKPCSSTCSKK